jgi:hypothetical protein
VYRAIVLLKVRLECDRSHHWNDVQKKNDIAEEWIRRFMSQVDFDIRPHELRNKPRGEF